MTSAYYYSRRISAESLSSPELGVETWELDLYIEPTASRLPMILPLDEVHCQLSRCRLEHVDPPLWMTTTMDRVSALLSHEFCSILDRSSPPP